MSGPGGYGGEATSVGLRGTSGWVGVAGVVAGGVAGVVTGVVARLAMRAVALSEDAPTAPIQTPEGELALSRLPVLTLEGTVAVIIPVVFVGLFLGFILTLMRLTILRSLSPAQRAATYSVLMLIAIFLPFYRSTSEFDVGFRAVGIAGFAFAFIAFAVVFEAVMVAVGSRLPRPRADETVSP